MWNEDYDEDSDDVPTLDELKLAAMLWGIDRILNPKPEDKDHATNEN